MNKIIIITAPSGSGKTTILKEVMKAIPELQFSISACTRNPRQGETDGVDYYFITESDFNKKIEKEEFLEWEMVYEGRYYGTPKSEVDRICNNGKIPIVDIDVVGALNVKRMYSTASYSIFIQAPSIAALEERLIKRGTETPESLKQRVEKASEELNFADQFDTIIVNDDLQKAIAEVTAAIQQFIK